MKNRSLSLTGLAIALALFFAVNIFSAKALRSTRLDLTEEGLYTLTDGTRNILEGIEEPINLYLYYSEGVARGLPGFANFGTRVRELLDEFVLRAGGKLTLEVLEPEPFSEVEDRAVEAGLAGVPTGNAGEVMYFGLVATNSVGDEEVIAFFHPSKEEFVEYDVARLIYTLDHPERPTLGLITTLPMNGRPSLPQAPQMAAVPPWQILSQIERSFDLVQLGTRTSEIPADVDLLMVAHPKDLPDRTLYAIDQFVLRGGRAIVFVDPVCEADLPPEMNDPMQMLQVKRSSTLDPVLRAWGVELAEGRVAADSAHAVRVGLGDGAGDADYVVWTRLTGDECFNRSEPSTGSLDNMLIAAGGVLRPLAAAGTEMVPLITTSKEAMAIDADAVSYWANPNELLANYLPGGEALTIAARVTGQVRTAFPEGQPADPSANPEIDEPVEPPPHLAESNGPINVIVVADADLLDDRFWIQEQRLGPISLGFRKTSDNGDFVLNALEQMGGTEDLISIRGRSSSRRPFEKVDEIRRKAEIEFQARQQELERKLRETEAKLAELQSADPEESGMILSPQQEAELEKFRQQRLKTRKELRDVRHNQRKDIESLGTRIKLANIVGLPALVALLAIGLGAWRVSRRKS